MPPPPPPEPMPPPPVAIAAPMAPAAPDAPPAGSKLTWGAWSDAYYMYLGHSTGLPANTLTGAAGSVAFDTNTQQRHAGDWSALALNASLEPGSLPASTSATARPAPSSTPPASGGGTTLTPPVPGPFIVLQAYGSLTLLGKFSFDFGKFYTTAGAEVIQANKNWLYSRSLLFYAIPLLHTGARANFKVNDMLALQASLVERLEQRSGRQRPQDVRPVGDHHARADRHHRRDDLHRQGSGLRG